jgi:ABC-2 type transport system ATP-binding protein
MTGTTGEIVAKSGLTVYVIEGVDLAPIALQLENAAGVDQVASFGATLHVVGRNASALKAAVDAAVGGSTVRLRPGETTLEDVLIDLMGTARETAIS